MYAALSLCLLLLEGCGSGFKTFPPGTILSPSATTVWVYPQAGEDLHGPCVYDLFLQEPLATQAGTLVIYERGDSSALYNDSTVQQAARALHYSMVYAEECNAVSTGSFQADASKGQARALFAALTQLGINTSHPELGTGGVVIYGFSAAGVLAATMANAEPGRIFGEVEYASGDAHVNLDDVPITAAAVRIPTLLLANGQDAQSGTFRSLKYFERGRAAGALWSYGVQHATDHCCTLSTRSVLLPWLSAVAAVHGASLSSTGTVQTTAYPNQAFTQFTCTPDETVDAQGYTDCEFTRANILSLPPSTGTHGWLPDQISASAWRSWVLNPTTNDTD